MATAIIVLCLCSSLSSSGVVGGFFGGLIPGTVPHYARITEADKLKQNLETLKLEDIEGSTFDTWGSPGYCQALKTYTELADAYSPSEIPIGPITLGKDQRIKYEYQHFDNDDMVKKLYNSYPIVKVLKNGEVLQYVIFFRHGWCVSNSFGCGCHSFLFVSVILLKMLFEELYTPSCSNILDLYGIIPRNLS
jgi:hypothetical protein